MNWSDISFDRNQARAFLATSEEGSLPPAACALNQTQPTLSRQVADLEQALGVTLLGRGHRQVRLTGAVLFYDLVPVLPERFKPDVPAWLVANRELRTSRRIRIVYDLLAEALAQLIPGLH